MGGHRIPGPFGPVIGPVNPGRFRHVLPEKRQIVRPTREKYGKLPGFGPFDRGLISVRSVVRVYPGPLKMAGSKKGRTGCSLFHVPQNPSANLNA